MAQPTGGPGGPGPHRNLTTKFLQTMKSMKHVQLTGKSITGSVFVFVSREAAILAQNALKTYLAAPSGPAGGAHNAAPDSLAEFRGEEGWQRKTAGQREGERVRKGEKAGCEGREGWGGKEESKGKSGCAPPETKSWLRHWQNPS